MGFNLGNMISGAATGFLMGGPAGAAAGAAAGAISGNANAATGVGNLGNAGQNGWQGMILAQQDLDNFKNAAFSVQLNEQTTQFNNMMDERSELMREGNQLRDVAMEQRKADMSITKEFIKSIG